MGADNDHEPDIERLRIELCAQITYGRKLAEHAEDMLRLLELLTGEPSTEPVARRYTPEPR